MLPDDPEVQQFWSTMESCPMGVLLCPSQGRKALANNAFKEILGCEPNVTPGSTEELNLKQIFTSLYGGKGMHIHRMLLAGLGNELKDLGGTFRVEVSAVAGIHFRCLMFPYFSFLISYTSLVPFSD